MFGRKKINENVKPILVYKYRGGGDEIFERDLTSIEKNFFWASSIKDLNDPCEGIVTDNSFANQSRLLNKISGKEFNEPLSRVNEALQRILSDEKMGVYSLSKCYDDELLWAHYANSHQGFCIEYDLETLLKSFHRDRIFSFSIDYRDKPYDISVSDIATKSNELIKKKIGLKSKRWKYEKEYRVVTDFWGKHSYNYKAVRAIYFGLRMNEESKKDVMNRLKGRGVKYFQMRLSPKSYQFYKEQVDDLNGLELNYLQCIPDYIVKGNRIGFKIIEKQYFRLRKKGNIKIEIDSSISIMELKEFGEYIQEHLFQEANIVGVFYYVKNQKDKDMAWATSHYKNQEVKAWINEYVEIS